jgi:hypothetical protein
MGQIENTVEFTRKIEALLVEELRAEGRGLHEKVSSVERKLPGPLVKRLRYIASVRNKMMHDDYQLQEPEDFYAACEQTLRELGERIETLKSAAAAAVASGPVDSPASRLTPQAPITMQPLTVGVLIVVLLGVIAVLWHKVDTLQAASARVHARPLVVETESRPRHTAAVGHVVAQAAPAQPVPMIQMNVPPERPQSHSEVSSRLAEAHSAASSRLPGSAAMDAALPVTLEPNRLGEFSQGSVQRHDGFMGAALVIHGVFSNTGRHGLTYINTVADVYVPRMHRWIRGVHQMILFPGNGLAPGHSEAISMRLGGSFGSYSLSVPDVVNAPDLKVLLWVTSGTDRMGDTLSPSGAVTARNGE